MPDRDRAALLDIARAIRLVQEFKHGLSAADFLEDAKTQSAVLHQLLDAELLLQKLDGCRMSRI